MLRRQSVQTKDRDLIWNINQKYLYEMISFYDDLMNEKGNTIIAKKDKKETGSIGKK